MENKKTKSKPIGPAAKTEAVTLRLDPKTRFGLELLARSQYRTLSSVVEWAINVALRDEGTGISQLDNIWDVSEADRLVKLALLRPDLLNYEEQLIWKIISENGYFWKGGYGKVSEEWEWKCHLGSAVYDRIREHFNKIVAVAKGEAKASSLPTWIKKTPHKDEIPF